MRPGGGDPDTPGWTTRVVPNLYPALARPTRSSSGGYAAKRAVTAAEAGAFSSGGDPLLASRRAGEPDLFASRPASGAHEVIVNAPQHATAMAELPDEQIAAAVETWRERMRAHSDAPYVQLIVNEGGAAGASLEHTHAQLYALPFVPAAVARERERAGAYRERTAGGGLLSEVLVEEVRRRERLVAIDDEAALICPWASRSPFELRIVPARASRRASPRTRRARRCWPRRCACWPSGSAARPSSTSGCAPRRAAAGGLPLAHRHRAAALGQGRLRARHRRRHQHLPARAGRGRPARDCSANRLARAVPPNPRPIPRFIADSTQEGIPHGRFAERLGGSLPRGLRRASTTCPRASSADGELDWFPERAWGGRVWVPCSTRAEGPEGELELFGHVSYVQPEEGDPERLPGQGRLHRRARRGQPRLEDRPQRRRDRPLARRERPRRRRHPRLGPPPPPGRRRRHRRARLETVDQEAISNGRFTLIALDALEGYGDEILMQVKLWSSRAKELASESLYD